MKGAVTAALARAWDALIGDELRYTAATRAMVRSVERAQGAAEARDCVWLNRQNRAARHYAALATGAIARESALYATLRRALHASVLGAIDISPAQASTAKTEIASHGLPLALRTALAQTGLTAGEVANLTAAIDAAPPQQANLLDTITQVPSGQRGEIGALRGLEAAAGRVAHCRTSSRRTQPRHQHRRR